MKERKKILFVTHNPQNESDGVWKKIKYQVRALRNLQMDVDFFHLSQHKTVILDNQKSQVDILSNAKLKFLFYYYVSRKIESTYNILYIRKPHGGLYSLFLLFLIRKVKKLNPNCYVYIEVPTFPYDKEIKGIKDYISEACFRLTLPLSISQVDEILYIGEKTDCIWGVKARQISNGINLEDNPMVATKYGHSGNFEFVGVAHLAFWHGYDRLIKSMSEYTGERQIIFHIVGGGEPELTRLKKIVEGCSLEGKVIFHGKLQGLELTTVLSHADVCVDSLGRHRSGNNINNSIKSKEYTARGLPFIKSHIDNSFGDERFIYQISADENVFSIEEIINWRESLGDKVRDEERTYAINNLTWEKQFGFIDNQ
ncbi:glycosyltransferase [Serratia fonticola]|uniref:glycosyltransferase n=1 Tax=Serratia fonticola TaxID=47917 RepID=UPI0021B810AA|nr:glycosyltransferase [Serratia fonticola]